MYVNGVPFDAARKTNGDLNPVAGVLHRTYGRWPGDYSVGKNAPNGTSFHFLVGKEEGQWVQFADTLRKCGHAPGANSTAIAIEFTGRNEEPLTDWQSRAGSWIIAATSDAHGIAREYYNGPRRPCTAGWTTHASVLGSDHSDTVTRQDWDAMAARWAPAPAPEPPKGDGALPPNKLAPLYPFAEAARGKPVLQAGSSGVFVSEVQNALNVIAGQPVVSVDGDFGPATEAWVKMFQQSRGLSVDGVVGFETWVHLLVELFAKVQ